MKTKNELYKTALLKSNLLFVALLSYDKEKDQYLCEIPIDSSYKTYFQEYIDRKDLTDFCL